MGIDWEEILMDPVVQGAIITASGAIALAALAGFFKIILSFRDKKLFDEIKTKIGNHKSDTLEMQHENIKEAISGKLDSVGKIVADNTINLKENNKNEFNRIYAKVDKINSTMDKNEIRYENLNLDQRIVRSNVEKLVYDWERIIVENKELKGRITELEKKNKELISIINKSKRKSKDMEL